VDEIRPALSPEEWERGFWHEDKEYTSGALRVQIGERRIFIDRNSVRGVEIGQGDARSGDLGPFRHALAALALYGQPFGFTLEMLGALRRVMADEYDAGDWDLVYAVAERIAALLPPWEVKHALESEEEGRPLHGGQPQDG
jgi:hypothetical protein